MRPHQKAISAIVVIWLLSSGASGPAVASTESTTLTDLAWIAGEWLGEEGDTTVQEIWTQPLAGTMIGMFRLTSDGEPRFYEFMSIEMGDGGPVLRIKHFDPDLRGWEEREESVIFTLKEASSGKAIFETELAGNPEFLTYERAGEELTITLEKPAKKSSSVFRFKRIRP